jgi:hypothetical protein
MHPASGWYAPDRNASKEKPMSDPFCFGLRTGAILMGLAGSCMMPPASAEDIFLAPSQAEYRDAFASATAIYQSRQQDYVVFANMLAQGWVHAHREQAPTEAQLWELPTANDWVGCIAYQFPKPEIFERVKFRSYAHTATLTRWITEHEKSATKIQGGRDLIRKLKELPDWATRCENLVRSDDRSAI